MLILLLSFMLTQDCNTYDLNNDGFVYYDDIPLSLDYSMGSLLYNVTTINLISPCLETPTIAYTPPWITSGNLFTVEIDFIHTANTYLFLEPCSTPGCFTYFLPYAQSTNLLIVESVPIPIDTFVTYYVRVLDMDYNISWLVPFTIEVRAGF